MIIENYPGYRDVEVDLLGKIPAHWQLERLKSITDKVGDGLHATPTYVETSEYFFINGNNLKNDKIVIFEDTHCVDKNEYEKYKLDLKKTTLLMSINGTIGSLAFYNNEQVVLGKSVAYMNFKKSQTLRYYFYLLKSVLVQDSLMMNIAYSFIKNLSLEGIRDAFLLIPPKEEALKIILLLDKKTSQIDQKINLFQSKKASYEELKKSLINETVCRGLNKSVELKESGVEWIGKVPKHWKVNRLKDEFDLMSSGVAYFEGTKEYLSTKSISNNIIEEIEETITYENRPDRANMQPALNSIWFAKLRFTDKSYLFENSEEVKKYVVSTGFAGLLCNQAHKKFAYYYIISTYFLFQKDRYSYGTTQEAITEPNINQIIFIQPPKPEQIQIAKYLDEKTSKIDKIISKIDEQINTLTEFRKTLINDVVTGKVRVAE